MPYFELVIGTRQTPHTARCCKVTENRRRECQKILNQHDFPSKLVQQQSWSMTVNHST